MIPRLNEYEQLKTVPPCAGPGGCVTIGRTLSAFLANTNGTIAGSDNMIQWVKQFDMTQINWGTIHSVSFSTYTDTGPSGEVYDQNGWLPYSETAFYAYHGGTVAALTSAVTRTQVWLGGSLEYFILAIGFTTPDGNTVSVEGCTSIVPTNPACVPDIIVELPVPDLTLGYNCDTYLFRTLAEYPSLTAMAADLCPRYGTNWNPNQQCNLIPPHLDPFLG